MQLSELPPHPRLVVLDRARAVQQSLLRFLSREGYAARATGDCQQALDWVAANEVDFLLADLGIQGVLDFLGGARGKRAHVVTIVLADFDAIELAVAAVRAGAFEYVTKPLVDDELRGVLARARRHRSLVCENHTLRHVLDQRLGAGSVIGQDVQMRTVFDLVDAVADSRTTVLMTGESGTGKSMIARAIHARSRRREKPFVEVSCGALPESLLESELFGHARGAFTGAIADKPGRFLLADGGTIFLDEINSAPPAMQAKLLRVLQEREFEPVGSARTQRVDVRVVLASNMDLAKLVAAGTFRQDLFYRINVLTVRLPPLRDRPDDIPRLAAHFLRRFAADAGRPVPNILPAALESLQRHDWPGNVRELENAIERAIVLSRRDEIDVADLPEAVRDRPADGAKMEMSHGPLSLEAALLGPERRIIESALRRNAWNRQATAAELAINRVTLYKKMRKHGLDRDAAA